MSSPLFIKKYCKLNIFHCKCSNERSPTGRRYFSCHVQWIFSCVNSRLHQRRLDMLYLFIYLFIYSFIYLFIYLLTLDYNVVKTKTNSHRSLNNISHLGENIDGPQLFWISPRWVLILSRWRYQSLVCGSVSGKSRQSVVNFLPAC